MMDALKLLKPGVVLDLGFSRQQGRWERVESEVGSYLTPDGHRGEARITMSGPRHTVLLDGITGEELPNPDHDMSTVEGRNVSAGEPSTAELVDAWIRDDPSTTTYLKEL